VQAVEGFQRQKQPTADIALEIVFGTHNQFAVDDLVDKAVLGNA
jgi:hypothetical protein